MTIKTTKDIAKDLRQGLKSELELNRNHVSVKTQGFETIEVEVKKEDIKKETVKQYAKQFEDIDRDERTGEILAGGNTFIHVR